jgi:hypothetical protein
VTIKGFDLIDDRPGGGFRDAAGEKSGRTFTDAVNATFRGPVVYVLSPRRRDGGPFPWNQLFHPVIAFSSREPDPPQSKML